MTDHPRPFDPSEKRELRVRKDHLSGGVRQNSKWCAYDLAMQEQIPGALRVDTTKDGFRISVNGTRFYAPPTAVSARYIAAWDDGEDLEPFVDHIGPWVAMQSTPKSMRQPRVARIRLATDPAPQRSPRSRIRGERVTRTIDDDLKEYDEIKARVRRKAAS